MADAAADPFANGANPFIGPTGPPNVDLFANGANPFLGPEPVGNKGGGNFSSPHPGALANAPSDGYGMSALKGLGTAAIKGIGDIPGIIGNMNDAGEMVGNYGLAALQTGLGFRGSISEQAAKNAAALEAARASARASGAPVAGDYVPTGATFSNPVLAKTGEYVPESPLGRVGMAGVEAATAGAAGPFGEGGVLPRVARAGADLVSGAAGQGATEVTGNPVAGLAVGAAGQQVAHVAGNVATHGVSAALEAVPPITEAQKVYAERKQVGTELNTVAANPQAAQTNLATANPEIVPESKATMGPLSGDTGLNAYEKAVSQSPAGQAAYANRMAEQNAARQAAVKSIQPTGDVTDLPEAIRTNAASADTEAQGQIEAAKAASGAANDVVDQATAEHVQRAQEAHQAALAGIQALSPDASPQEVATHFRALRDAMEAQGTGQAVEQQSAADAARGASLPIANTPDQVGENLRAPFDAKAQVASDAVSRLYKALPKDMVAPTFDIAAKAKGIQAGMLPEHSPIGGEEARLYGLASGYGDETPLANVNALRGSVLSARSALRQSDPQAYGRLGQLLPPIEASLDHAIENRAALDNIAVRRGTMAPEDAIGPRVDNFWKDELDRQNYNLNVGEERYAQNAGRAEGGSVGGNGASSAGGGGPGSANGYPGISEGTGNASGRNQKPASKALVSSLPNAPKDLSLNRYLASIGGLRPSPELGKIFDKENPSYSGGKLIRQNGLPLDRALQAAKEGGYLFDPADLGRGELTLSHNDLLDKIAEDHRTGGVVPYGSANEDWHMALEARAHEKDLRKALGDIGVNPAKVDPNVIRRSVSHMLDGDVPLEAFGKGSAEFHNEAFGPTTEEGAQGSPPLAEEQPISSPQWEVKGSSALREANTAYREKKQTFDEGPIGEAFAKVGRGEPAYSNAELAGKVFHARPTAGEDMRAYLKAAGPEGVKAASDAAALSFHNAAMRDGALDPKRAQDWIAKHKGALAELPDDVQSRFGTAAGAQKAVEETMARTRDNLSGFDKSEAGKVAGLSNEGDIVKHVGSILDSGAQPAARMAELRAKADGNPAAIDGLKRASIESVLNKFLPENAEPNTDRMQAYIASKRDILSKVMSPAEIGALSSKAEAASSAKAGVKQAQESRAAAIKATQREGEASVKEAEDSRKEILSRYDKGVLGRLKGLGSSETDIINTVGRALRADNGATQMEILAKEAAKVPGASDALKKAVAESIHRQVQSTAEAGASGELQMKRAELQKVMSKQTDALKAAGLSDPQIGVLRAVVEDGLRANRVISATSAKGGSDSVQNLLRAIEMGKGGHNSILGHIAIDTALAAVGHAGGGILGAFLGKTLGDKVIGAMRDAGLDRIQKLRVQAVLDPKLAHDLMQEFPLKPNQGTAAPLGLRLRQMSLAGILAAQKH